MYEKTADSFCSQSSCKGSSSFSYTPPQQAHTSIYTAPTGKRVLLQARSISLQQMPYFSFSTSLGNACLFFLCIHLLLLNPNSGEQHVFWSSVTWGIVRFSFTFTFGFLYFCRLQPGNWKMGHRKPGLLHLSQFVIAALVLFF